MAEQKHNKIVERPPVIVVTGHIDHGKSSLLDYIRKSNIVEGEAGGITQHTSAYEVTHKNDRNELKRITFLDTPGHEAFSAMRARGVVAADIAILVVSAEDSVKAQTIESIKAIEAGKIPYIIAINKIDKASANPDKVKIDLAENGVYAEGFGGNIPCVLISAKTGTGISELLDMILLVAEMAELKGDHSVPAEGVIIESHMDPKRGITATLLIQNGTLKNGTFIVAEDALAPARLISDFAGKSLEEATFSSPISIAGFNKLPRTGAIFASYEKKKDAEETVSKYLETFAQNKKGEILPEPEEGVHIVPLIVKADVLGTLEAIEKELSKIKKEGVKWKIVQKGIGAISESDVKLAGGMAGSLLIAFNVKTDKSALDLADRLEVKINSFNVIYKIAEWLEPEMDKQKPMTEMEETAGTAKILKCFSRMKDKQVVGGRIISGSIPANAKIKIMRRDFEIGRGEIEELQQYKTKIGQVNEGEFGINIESKTEIAPGDIIEAYITVTK